jgi:hypothetical protein
VESIGAGSPTLVDAGAVVALNRMVMTAGTETDAGAIAAQTQQELQQW